MKLITEMGSIEFYTHRLIEMANLANVERIQHDNTAIKKHLDDIIKLAAIAQSWVDLKSATGVMTEATVNGKKPSMMGKCTKDTVILKG